MPKGLSRLAFLHWKLNRTLVDLIRASILLRKKISFKMDCRVKPGNDDIMLSQNRVTISESAGRGRSSLGFDGVPM